MQLEFSPRALADLAEIRSYHLDHASEQAADNVRRYLLRRFDAIAKKPSLGIASSRDGVRILNPSKYPYRIYFAVIGAVVILHVRHTARRLPDVDNL